MSIGDRLVVTAYLQIREVILVSVIEALHDAGPVTLAVVPHAHKAVHHHQQASGDRSHDHYDKPGHVARRILFLEHKRADEVS
jgi:hypothetical protein